MSRLDLTVESGEIVGPHRSQRRRQDHRVPPDRGLSPAERRAPSASRATSIVGLKPHAICRRGLARTFQLVQPFAGLTALENVMVGAFNREREVATARSQAGEILDFVGLGPAPRRARAGHLTLADRKRLEMARGLATRPGAAAPRRGDVGAERRPRSRRSSGSIRRIHERGVSLLIIEHVMQAIMALSHRLVVLHHGEKIADGPPAAGRARPASDRGLSGRGGGHGGT